MRAWAVANCWLVLKPIQLDGAELRFERCASLFDVGQAHLVLCIAKRFERLVELLAQPLLLLREKRARFFVAMDAHVLLLSDVDNRLAHGLSQLRRTRFIVHDDHGGLTFSRPRKDSARA